MTVRLDHLVLAVPELAAALDEFAATTGVAPAPGGAHVGLGTANALVGLTGAGAGGYLEIVGPDPDQPAPGRPRPLHVDEVVRPQLVTWAVRPDPHGGRAAFDELLAAARTRGHDAGAPSDMSRRTRDGELLRWRLTPAFADGAAAGSGVVPFLIDWGDTTHPTARGLPNVELVALHATHPNPDGARARLTALGLELPLQTGPAALHAVLRTPRGEEVL